MQGPGVEFDLKFFRQFMTVGMSVMLLFTLLLYACDCKQPKRKPPKYKQGDVVWLKPDSTRAVISQVWSGDNEYSVEYYDAEHKPQGMHVPEYGIYSVVTR